MALYRVLGTRIKSLREGRDWDVGQLAYKSHVSAGYIYKLENNERPNVSGVILAQLAVALSTTVEYLLGLTNDPRPLPRNNTPDLDPDHLARLQRIAERVARLPEERQQIVMDALLTLLSVEDALRDVQEGHLFPESKEDQPGGSRDD